MREAELRVDGVRTVLRSTGPEDAREAVVFLHGNPGSGADWVDLMGRLDGGLRAVAWDAPGFGKADKPEGFQYDVAGYTEFTGRALDLLGIERAHLVVHDFGGLWGLQWAADHPDRFASAVIIDTGVLLGYRWHILARLWRTRLLGEVFMATTTRPGFRLLLRRGNPNPLPREFLDRMYDDFDRGTKRAVLRLYRATDAARWSETVTGRLAALDRPALVIWGAHDPYLPVAQAEVQRRTFPGAEIRTLEGSGHWPFVDAPDAVGSAVTEFLRRATAG